MNVKYAVTGVKRFIAPGPIWAYKNESPGYGFIGTRRLSWSPFLRTKQTKNIPCSWSVCNVYIANPVFLLMFIMKCKKNELNKTLCKNLLTVIGGQCACEKFLFMSKNCFCQWNMFKSLYTRKKNLDARQHLPPLGFQLFLIKKAHSFWLKTFLRNHGMIAHSSKLTKNIGAGL